MKKTLLLIFFSSLFLSVSSQSLSADSVDQKVAALKPSQFKTIPELAQWIELNFVSKESQLKATFSWVAHNISYDVAALKNQESIPFQLATAKAFANRKAVCEGYAGLMDSLCTLLQIPSVTVSGYTYNNQILDPTPHMWVASFVNGQWWLSDPTWASGAIVNNKFKKDYDPSYFMRPASLMLKTHMPYDPLWQLLDEPLSHKGFIERNDRLRLQMRNPVEEITLFLSMPEIDRYKAELERIQQQNLRHPALSDRMNYLKNNIEVLEHNAYVMALREISQLFGRSVENYNQAVDLYNRRADKARVTSQLNDSQKKLTEAFDALNQLGQPPKALEWEKQTLAKSMHELQKNIKKFDMR